MAKKINIRLDDEMENVLKEIQEYYSNLMGIEVSMSDAVRLALTMQAKRLKVRGGAFL